jgi:hypothetical protein
VWRPKEQWPLGIRRYKGTNNIKMDLQGFKLGGMEWTDPVQCYDGWRAVVNCVMNLQVPQNAGNLQLFTVGIKIVCVACELLLWHVGLLV